MSQRLLMTRREWDSNLWPSNWPHHMLLIREYICLLVLTSIILIVTAGCVSRETVFIDSVNNGTGLTDVPSDTFKPVSTGTTESLNQAAPKPKQIPEPKPSAIADTGTPPPTATPTQTPTPSPFLFLVMEGTVNRVIDGDTVDFMIESGILERVRILGVDTPETSPAQNKAGEYNDITNIECLDSWGDSATRFAKGVLENKYAKLIGDSVSDERDYYDRLLAYLEIGGKDFGLILLENGYARAYRKYDYIRKEQYILTEEKAKAKKYGLWSCENKKHNST